MKTKTPTSVKGYLAALSPERRRTLSAVRAVLRRSLPAGFKEYLGYGMICYGVPLKTYADTYNGQPLCYAALASQKHYCSLYLMSVYADPAQRRALERAFRAAGKKPDMGKSCIRFQSPDDLPLETIGDLVARSSVEAFVAAYESAKRTSRLRESGVRPRA